MVRPAFMPKLKRPESEKNKSMELYTNQFFGANECVEEARKFVGSHKLTGLRAMFRTEGGQIYSMSLGAIPQVAFSEIVKDQYVGWSY